MSNKVILGAEAREQLVKGINTLADAVKATLGPNGRNVVYFDEDGVPQSTKDGVTVADKINLKDNLQNAGAQMIKQTAYQTNKKAGDGTTTSTVLAQAIIKEGLKYINNQENAIEIKRQLDKGTSQIIKHLREVIREEISNDEQLKQIASISANNDEEMGKLIAEAITEVGSDGVVYIEESQNVDSSLEIVEGMQFDRGYKSPYFVNDNKKMTCVLNDAYVFIANAKFSSAQPLIPLFQLASDDNKSLLLIADDVDGEALATSIVNKMRGTLNICVVKAPEFGDRRTLVLEDIATLTGATVYNPNKGMELEDFEMSWLGGAKTINVGKNTTTIVDGAGDADKISERMEDLQSQIENSTTLYETEQLQGRLSRLAGGVAVINIGGNTEAEIKEKKDRADDALNATQAAIDEGIIAGGGTSLIRASSILKGNNIGEKILIKACKQPFLQILDNAGYEFEEANAHATTIKKRKSKIWEGFNVKEGKITDFKEAGVIDPFKVTRNALENAVSIAGTILLTECVLVDEEEEKKDNGVDLSQFGM